MPGRYQCGRMDLRHFRYFQAVAEELSYSKAARRIHVAQPALSRAVKELEEEWGVRLLQRNRRTVALTAAGAVLLAGIGVLLGRLDELTRQVQRTDAGEEGELRLGYIGPPTQPFLGPVLREFRKRNPRVSVLLEERTPERVWEMTARGRLDIGLTRPVMAHESLGLKTMLLRRETLGAMVTSEHPLRQRARPGWGLLRDEPLIVLARREGVGLHDAILAACLAARFSPRWAYTPSVIGTVLSYVESGAGVGIIPESVAALGAGRDMEFVALWPRRTVDLVAVWREQDLLPPARAFLDVLRAGRAL